jgi:alpha-N-arabinofuranosidase
VSFASELHHADLKAANSKAKPDQVAPVTLRDVSVAGEIVTANLKPLSWNVVVLTV